MTASTIYHEWPFLCTYNLKHAACLMCRPMARDVILHPLFWNSEERLSFLRDASDRVELEDREENSVVLSSIEAIGPTAFGASWDTNLDTDLLDNLRRYRRYNFSSVRDLLRIIRNKSNHYRELPQDLQVLFLFLKSRSFEIADLFVQCVCYSSV